MSTSEIYSPGLEGVIAGETAISTITGGLRYCGYPVTELAEHATFEEVAYLLLYGELPNSKQLGEFKQRVAAARKIPEPLRNLLKGIPSDIVPMDAVRSAVSVLAHFDPDVGSNAREANLRKAERLLGQIPVAVAEQFRFSKGQSPGAARPDLGHRVYKHGDVRAGILKEYARKAAEAKGETKWEETAAIIEKFLGDEKNLFPNLDWPAGRLYYALGLEVPLYTPIFVMSRVAGWSAHVIEQLEHNRLIRPRGRYTGPDVRSVTPLAKRG